MSKGTWTASGLLIAAIVVTGTGGFPEASAAMGPKEYHQKGKEYAEHRLYIDAVEQFTQAIRTNRGEIPIEEVAAIFNSRGLAYEGLNDYGKAIDDFSNAINIDEKNAEFLVNRGLAYLHEKELDRAQNDFSKAIEVQPKNAAAYSSRGDVFLRTGDSGRAIADYARALELEPRTVSLWYSLGMAYKQKGDEERALQAFGKMLDADPNHAGAAYQKAALFSRQGKIDSACVWLDTAVENGFRDWSALKNDSDFNNLRKVDCYKRVLLGK